MKTLKITMFAFIVLALLALIVSIPALGGGSMGIVGGWVWKVTWSLIGLVGLVVVLALGGAKTVSYFWNRAGNRQLPAG